MHNAYSRFLDAANICIGDYHPEHVRDLENYLRTQPAALWIRGDHWHHFAAYLVQEHPGAVGAHSFFAGMGNAFKQQSGIAAQLHTDFKLADKKTMDRFADPRVNEARADVRNPLNTAQHIGLDTREMHPLHLHLIEASLRDIANCQPEDTTELLEYLGSVPEGLHIEGQMYRDLGDRLCAYPVPAQVPGYFDDYGQGYAALAELAGEVNSAFRLANPDDVDRIENPHPHQAWNNVSVPSA